MDTNGQKEKWQGKEGRKELSLVMTSQLSN